MVILPGVTRCQLKDFVADLYIRHRQKIKFTVKEEIIEDRQREHIEIDIPDLNPDLKDEDSDDQHDDNKEDEDYDDSFTNNNGDMISRK